MCGIAGLTLLDETLEPDLGALLSGMLTALSERGPDSAGVGVYHDDGRLDVTKDVGHPEDVCDRFAITKAHGYQGVGHTRMATESAVTKAHCHPFTPADGVCVVHNGSFSNHATVRRRLERDGVTFDSDNDSEVAARYIAQRLTAGDDLKQALTAMAQVMDGFYTLLVTTPTEFAVHRDPIACKPAVIAQAGSYIAMASEYRALTGLPGIKDAKVFEPTGLAASAHGGIVIVDGDASLRAGIALKGGTLAIAGDAGHLTGFMAQAGAILIGGDAGEALGDSLYEATIYVAGRIASLGADATRSELTEDDVTAVKQLCAQAGFDHIDPQNIAKITSARQLYHFTSRNAGSY